MKKIFAGTPHTKFIAAASALTWAIAMANSAGAAQLQEARVTQVVNDVKLLLEQSAPRPATISDLIRHGTAVRTGTQSRSELTFSDLTITRLGANTIFSFKEGTREMNLVNGAILFQVPKGSGGATIRTVGVTAAITGTTGIAEFHPATTSHPQLSKWLCLEGTFHLYLPNGQSVELGPGKMVTADGKTFSKVSTFDIAKLASTSLFLTGFDQPLASMNLIMLESENQIASSLLASTTTNPLDPARIVNVTSQAIVAEETPTSPAASPTPPITPTPPVSPTPPPPTPSKFGTPSVISSPLPYLITNGTVITTDPSITTNGVTDYGKIYRGQTDDGAFSLWAFGSTSAFDTALRIDNTFFADPSHLPIAVFKFESLSLTGNPTIDTSNGVPKLALLGVDGITSGPPGGTLTFTGLDLLVLATVNGSINLTSDVSFQDLHELVMYARGAGSDLTINSPISNIGILGLVAEDSLHLTNPGTMSVGKLDAITGGDLMLQIGGSLLLNGRVRLDAIVLPGASVASGINLTLNVTGDYTNSSATQFSHLAITNRDHIGGDASIAISATSISTANNFDLEIANDGGGSIGGDAVINVSAGSITASSLLAKIDNSNGGTVGASANISLATSGDFATSVGDATFTINNTAGTITNNADLALNAGDSISTAGQLSLLLENYDGSGNPAGHIRGSANVSLITGENLTADFASIAINNRNGGRIDSSASLMLNIGGALTTLQNGTDYFGFPSSLSLYVSNRYDGTLGSTIGGNATLALSADSADIGGNLNALISDRGGTIDGNALLNFNVAHDVTVQEDAVWQILNDSGTNMNAASPIGGTIHGTANLLLSATNLTVTAGSLELDIFNKNGGVVGSGGTIDSDTNITFTLSGNLTTAESAIFEILNHLQSGGTTGGTIGGDATINVTTANISAGVDSFGRSLDALIYNATGNIGGNAIMNVDVLGAINTTTASGPTEFSINNNAGTIGGDATINLSAANISTGGNLDEEIDNFSGGSINGSANLNFNLGSNLTAQGDANFQILNNDGGHVAGNGNIFVTTGGNFTANSILGFVNNRNGGAIGSGANINFDIGGALTTQGDAVFGISTRNDGAGGGTVGPLATVDLNAGSVSVGGFFQTFVATNGGGSIHGNATNTVTIGGNLTAQQGILVTIEDTIFGGGGNFTGGRIDGDAIVTLNAQNITTPSTNSGIPGTDVMAIEGSIYPNASGTVGGDAIINVSASQNISAPGSVLFWIANGNYLDLGGGTIGGDARVNISAASLSTGDLFAQILNYGGASIGGNAAINMIANNISTGGSLSAAIDNSSGLGNGFIGSTIGGDATINITAANLTANSLLAQINNTDGSIGANTEGGAMINMNVSNSATVTNGATVAIYGSDGAVGGAAININGGSYNVGGTFLSYIDGNGTITFNNASAHADVLKAGVFGANGVLNIGGGTLSADTTLKLYAPGSNGQLNFISNVTLGGNSTKILAANSITIFNNVVVTIGGSKPADVYTGFTNEVPNANYTGFGGNGSTTGTFGGAGANDPQPIENAPPFDSTNHVKSSGKPRGGGKATDTTINVSNSDELLALLNDVHPGRDGRIRIPDSKKASHGTNASRSNAAADVNAHRRAMDRRTASIPAARRLPQ